MPFSDDTIIQFGKHKGKKMSEVPDGYFLYLYDRNKLKGELKEYVENRIPMLRTLKQKNNLTSGYEKQPAGKI